MTKNYLKHIITLLCLWVGMATTAFCQQTDSTALAGDTTVGAAPAVVDSSSVTYNQDESEDTAVGTALKKFLTKEKDFTAQQRNIPTAEVKKATSDDAFWYANKPIPKEKEVQPASSAWINVSRFIFWLLVVGCFVAILAMYLGNNRVGFFKSKAKNIPGEETAVADDTEGNIFEMDFDKRINNALEALDYRLATRLLFLRLLRSMAERNIIKYGIDKTNMDYLFELGNTKYFKDFSAAARSYEYVWYGNFNIQQSQFMHVRQRLDDLTRQIKN